jgi:hypothetical protein
MSYYPSMGGFDHFGISSESGGGLQVSRNAKIVMGVLIGTVVAAAIGLLVWVIIDQVKLNKKKTSMRKHNPPATTSKASNPLFSGASASSSVMGDGSAVMRSNKSMSPPMSSDPSTCYNENLVGSYQAGNDQRAGNVRPAFTKMPTDGKAVPLSTNQNIGSNKVRSHGAMARQTPIDLSGYARLGMDRALGAAGLDRPEDLALGNVMLGVSEVPASRRLDTLDIRGETASSWRVGYTNGEPGNGATIPDQGPYSLAQRPVGVAY